MSQSTALSQAFARSRLTEAKETSDTVRDAGIDRIQGHTEANVVWEVLRGDAKAKLHDLPPDTFDCVITSPPYYWQRDYGVDGQIGKEKSIQEYVSAICEVMDGVRRVLAPSGLLFLNLGDTYYSAKGQPKGVDRKNGARRFGLRAVDASGLGVPRKTAIGIPWRVALEMISRSWTLRAPIIWHRPGSLPEPTAHDRPWRTHEHVFMFSKGPKYYFNRKGLGAEEDVWTIISRPKSSKGVHSAAFPDELVERCLSVGCPAGGKVLDPFAGTGTVLRCAVQSGRPAVGIDLSDTFCEHMVRELKTLSKKCI